MHILCIIQCAQNASQMYRQLVSLHETHDYSVCAYVRVIEYLCVLIIIGQHLWGIAEMGRDGVSGACACLCTCS